MTASGQEDSAPATAGAGEQEVASYLTAHPDFFDRHAEVLRQMALSHASGEAASLLERQLKLLREENRRLKSQFDELMAFARNNERLNARIHALVLALMDAAGPQAIFECLDLRLREDFGADFVATRVFAQPAFVDNGDIPAFVGPDSAAQRAFAQQSDAGQAVCGPLDPAHSAVLFGDSEIGSAVVLPLTGKQWQGVLVIASRDAERYDAGMGTDFLNYLKDVAALVIDPWVKRAAG